MSRTFLDVKEKDVIEVVDEYSHDINIHTLFVESVDFDKEFVTETNPEGKVCYCRDLGKDYWGDEYISVAHEGNFHCFSKQRMVVHWPYVVTGDISAGAFEFYSDADEATARAEDMCSEFAEHLSKSEVHRKVRPGIEDLVLDIPLEMQGLPKEKIFDSLVFVCSQKTKNPDPERVDYYFSEKEAEEEIVCRMLDYTSRGYTVEEESPDVYRVFQGSTEFYMMKIKPEILQYAKKPEELERD